MCNFEDTDMNPAVIVYNPTTDNEFHSEIYKEYDPQNNRSKGLTGGQSRYLARHADVDIL
ncbi:MAG: hypothetical protein PWQ85_823 [Geotoga sp.]|nr:hypothetical protein [Geotoga sp.]